MFSILAHGTNKLLARTWNSICVSYCNRNKDKGSQEKSITWKYGQNWLLLRLRVSRSFGVHHIALKDWFVKEEHSGLRNG